VPTEWERVKELYDRADELPAAERAAFLAAACGGDECLLGEVQSLLSAGDAAGSFLEGLPAFDEDAAALSGQTLGPYRLDSLLGHGAMGLVYRATDQRLGRTVAVKVLRPEVALTVEARRRFLRETQATAALHHPNIVTVHDTGHAAGRDFLVMEFVDGQTLADRLRSGPMPLAEALECAIQVASALEAAHQAGILHRDLKPQNVMLTGPTSGHPACTVKVLDFGLAKRHEGGPARSEASQTRTGAVMGTAAYMSPEQVEGRITGLQSDIFSFGAVLYEMIGGRRAFGGKSAGAAMAAVLRDQPKPLDSPPWGIVALCLEKDPTQRFQTAGELRAALENLRAGGRPAKRKLPAGRWRPVLLVAGMATAAAIVLL
jgi:eukaryotic-like serine/threonine-protein kinase